MNVATCESQPVPAPPTSGIRTLLEQLDSKLPSPKGLHLTLGGHSFALSELTVEESGDLVLISGLTEDGDKFAAELFSRSNVQLSFQALPVRARERGPIAAAAVIWKESRRGLF